MPRRPVALERLAPAARPHAHVDRFVAAGLATRFGGPRGPSVARAPSLVALVRRATGEGAEVVGFMLAVMRGDVAALYPPEPRGARPAPKRGTAADAAAVAAAVAEAFAPTRPRRVTLRDRMAAAAWLANRGWGRAPLVVRVEDDGPASPLDPGLLDADERVAFRALMAKMRAAPGPVLPTRRAGGGKEGG